MNTDINVLPGGYVLDGKVYDRVIMRSMTGNEEDIFTNRSLPITKRINMVLVNCIESLETDSGDKLTNKDDIAKAVMNLTFADRAYLLILLRVISHGPEYVFKAKCVNDDCKKEFTVGVDLSKIQIKPMVNKLQREFVTTLSSGKIVKWHILTSKDEVNLNDKNLLSSSILARINSVNDKPVDINFVKTLSVKEREELREAFNREEPDVDLEIIIVCSYCGMEMSSMIDLGQLGFFFPSRAPKVV